MNAKAEIAWETDDRPTGWSHRSDSPTYSSTTYATTDRPLVSSVVFDQNEAFDIDGHEMPVAEAQRILGPYNVRQLLNPHVYSDLMDKKFSDIVDGKEPPDRDDDYYDRYDDRDRYED